MMRQEKLKILVALAIAFMLGWMFRGNDPEDGISMLPSAQAGNIYVLERTSYDFELVTSNQSGTQIFYWRFKGQGLSSKEPPLLISTKTYSIQ